MEGTWTVENSQSGYLTGGFGARFAWFQLDAVTYGEEVGTADHPKENRRYMVEMSLDF